MTQPSPARSPAPEGARQSRDRRLELHRNEVTDIIPFNEFGNLDDLDFSDNSAFDKEAQVLRAPELDDLDDTDNLTVMPLAGPSEVAAERRLRRADPSPARAAQPSSDRICPAPGAAPQAADRRRREAGC